MRKDSWFDKLCSLGVWAVLSIAELILALYIWASRVWTHCVIILVLLCIFYQKFKPTPSITSDDADGTGIAWQVFAATTIAYGSFVVLLVMWKRYRTRRQRRSNRESVLAWEEAAE